MVALVSPSQVQKIRLWAWPSIVKALVAVVMVAMHFSCCCEDDVLVVLAASAAAFATLTAVIPTCEEGGRVNLAE